MKVPEIHIAIKSYKRAGRVRTFDPFPSAYLWIPESQESEYRQYHDRIITIPDIEDGNLSRKQNAILRRSPSPWTLILDDDISSLGYWEDGKHFWMEPDEILDFVTKSFIMAHDLGVELWGVNQNKDEIAHYTYRPFSFTSAILGPFHGHLSPTIYYDESVLGKDDYDFFLQNIQKHHRTLRFNKYHYIHDSGDLPGGFVSMRSMDAERRGVYRMRQKWGDTVFREGGAHGGKHATGENILNSFVRVPIKGA